MVCLAERFSPLRLQGCDSHTRLGIDASYALREVGATRRFVIWMQRQARELQGTALDLTLAALSLSGLYFDIAPTEAHHARLDLAMDLRGRGVHGDHILELTRGLISFYDKKGESITNLHKLVMHTIERGQFCKVPPVEDTWFLQTADDKRRASAAADIARRLAKSMDVNPRVQSTKSMEQWVVWNVQKVMEEGRLRTA